MFKSSLMYDGALTMQSLKSNKKQLEGDSFFNRKPVEFKQDRGNVVRFRGHGNQSYCRILNSL